MHLGWVALAISSVAAACRPAPPRPVEQATVSVPAPAVEPVAVSRDAPRRSLTNELAGNRRELLAVLEEQGFVVNRTVEIDAGLGVVVVSEPDAAQAPAAMTSRVDVVGPGSFRELFKETSLVDVVYPAKGGAPVWDLRGDGGTQVIITLTPCGANCGQPEPWTVELTPDGPREMSPAPACPSCVVAHTAQGAPVLADYIELTIASCARVSCGPSYALSVEVPRLVTWDGSVFSDTASSLRAVYEARYHARKHVGALTCPLDQLRAAAELYFQLRVLGRVAPIARAEVNREYPPQPTTPCLQTHSLLSSPRSWDQLLDELEDAAIPVLEREPARQ